VFWGFNDDSPGALVNVLREFADRDINLTKIESRPRRVRLGHYMFFADLDGAEDEPPVGEALAALRERVRTLKVLGSYAAAPATVEGAETGLNG
jgi:prephenate dehydratase